MKRLIFVLMLGCVLCASNSAWTTENSVPPAELFQPTTNTGTWPTMTPEQQAAWDQTAQRYQQQYGTQWGNSSPPQLYDPYTATGVGVQSHTNVPTAYTPPPTSYAPPPDSDISPFAKSVMASREAQEKARLEAQKKVQNELKQINDKLPEELNCYGNDCYDVYDNPENPNEATHMAPTGLSNKIDIK